MSRPLPKIGVDHFGYWILDSDTDTSDVAADYGSFYPIKGITAAKFNPNSGGSTFYADNGLYESATYTGDIDVTISVAEIPPADFARLFGSTYGASTGLVEEYNTDAAPYVAIGFRAMKSDGHYRYISFKKGRFTKPSEDVQTKGNSISFQTQDVIFKGVCRTYDGKYKAWVDSDDSNLPAGVTDTVLNNESTGFFSTPDYTPVATTTPISDLAAVSGDAGGEIDLTFTAAASATSVKAQIADPAILTWTDATTSATLTAASTSATITGLTEGNTYSVRLVVVGGTKAGISNTDDAVAYDAA